MTGRERVRHLCPCGSEWISQNHTRCEGCGKLRTDYSQGLHQGYLDATAAAKATITGGVCKEAYERGVAEERERLLGELAGPATTVSFLAAEDDTGDAVRWSDVERICATTIRARNPSPAEDSQ